MFKIKSYSKAELAMLYFPDSDPHVAVNHLMRWIYGCKPLMETSTRPATENRQNICWHNRSEWSWNTWGNRDSSFEF